MVCDLRVDGGWCEGPSCEWVSFSFPHLCAFVSSLVVPKDPWPRPWTFGNKGRDCSAAGDGQWVFDLWEQRGGVRDTVYSHCAAPWSALIASCCGVVLFTSNKGKGECCSVIDLPDWPSIILRAFLCFLSLISYGNPAGVLCYINFANETPRLWIMPPKQILQVQRERDDNGGWKCDANTAVP